MVINKVYNKTSHFSNWLENTKDIKPQQYTDDQKWIREISKE